MTAAKLEYEKLGFQVLFNWKYKPLKRGRTLEINMRLLYEYDEWIIKHNLWTCKVLTTFFYNTVVTFSFFYGRSTFVNISLSIQIKIQCHIRQLLFFTKWYSLKQYINLNSLEIKGWAVFLQVSFLVHKQLIVRNNNCVFCWLQVIHDYLRQVLCPLQVMWLLGLQYRKNLNCNSSPY